MSQRVDESRDGTAPSTINGRTTIAGSLETAVSYYRVVGLTGGSYTASLSNATAAVDLYTFNSGSYAGGFD